MYVEGVAQREIEIVWWRSERVGSATELSTDVVHGSSEGVGTGRKAIAIVAGNNQIDRRLISRY